MRQPSLRHLAASAIAVLALAGCKDECDTSYGLDIYPALTEAEFSAKASETYTFTVNTLQSSWQAKPAASWAVVSQNDDEGTFTLTALPNTTGKFRETAVTVSAKCAPTVNLRVTQDNVEVHLAGRSITVPTQKSVARYWKDGVGTDLTDGTVFESGSAVAVSGDKVYVAGYASPPYKARVWHIGDPVTEYVLSAGSSDSKAIAVSGNDVYIAGTESSAGWRTTVWKLGDPFIRYYLTDGTEDAFGTGIAISGNDIYVSGYEYNGTKNVAKVWKLGNPVTEYILADGTNSSYATGIVVSGSAVYVSGYEYGETNNIAKVWKLGDPVVGYALTDGTKHAAANAISTYGGDIYAAGNEDVLSANKARVWKLSGNTATEHYVLSGSSVNAIAISERGDIYAAGWGAVESKMGGKVWKNGKLLYSPKDSSEILGIALK